MQKVHDNLISHGSKSEKLLIENLVEKFQLVLTSKSEVIDAENRKKMILYYGGKQLMVLANNLYQNL